MDEEKKEEDDSEKDYKKPEERYEKPENPLEKKKSLTDKVRGNPFILSTLICGVLAILLLVVVTTGGGITGKAISGDIAANNLIEFLDNPEITLVDVESFGNFYRVMIEYKEEEIPVYVTKDGKYYTPNLLPLSYDEEEEEEEVQEIPKSDKPVVELFVMTHCPYGTQAEKGLIPVIKALGDTIDAKIRFVHYFMHDPEEEETPRQICIREEQSERYLDYLECFLEDEDADRCLTEAGIDKTALNGCISKRADGYYESDSDLSEGYGVQGSPTLVINGVIVSSARSPAAYLDTICQAFNDAPEECGTELSSSTPSAGFGWDTTGSSTSAQC